MRTLEDIMSKRSPVGDIGVEVEVERKVLTIQEWPKVRNWVSKSDGSLRNGIEYVTRNPIKVDDDLKSKRLGPLFEALGDQIDKNSIRTSCHVHINALRLTPIEVMNTITLYWLVENILSDRCGEERKRNSYAHLLIEVPDHINALIPYIVDREFFNKSGINSTRRRNLSGVERYRALNVQSLCFHGTLEYRGMFGNYDADDMTNWIKTLYHIQHTMSKSFSSPKEIMDKYIANPKPEKFLRKICGGFYKDLDFSKDKLALVEENAITLCPLVYCLEPVTTWEEWQELIYAEHSKKKTTPESVVTAQSPLEALADREIQYLERTMLRSNTGTTRTSIPRPLSYFSDDF